MKECVLCYPATRRNMSPKCSWHTCLIGTYFTVWNNYYFYYDYNQELRRSWLQIPISSCDTNEFNKHDDNTSNLKFYWSTTFHRNFRIQNPVHSLLRHPHILFETDPRIHRWLHSTARCNRINSLRFLYVLLPNRFVLSTQIRIRQFRKQLIRVHSSFHYSIHKHTPRQERGIKTRYTAFQISPLIHKTPPTPTWITQPFHHFHVIEPSLHHRLRIPRERLRFACHKISAFHKSPRFYISESGSTQFIFRQ